MGEGQRSSHMVLDGWAGMGREHIYLEVTLHYGQCVMFSQLRFWVLAGILLSASLLGAPLLT